MTANISFYSQLVVAIDGRLQKEAQSIALFHGIEGGQIRTRITIRWAMNVDGLEFDPRPHVGSKQAFQIAVLAAEMGEHLFCIDGRVASCGVDGTVDEEGSIWAVFEVPLEAPIE
jgi:hypothetical protein